MAERPAVTWRDARGAERRARWWSEHAPAPARLAAAGDDTPADRAFARLRAGDGLAYEGDFHNARQLLDAASRRLRPPAPRAPGIAALFLAEREGVRAAQEVLSRLAVPVGPGWTCALRRAPALEAPLSEAFGDPPDGPALLPLRELRGAIGAHEWHRRGVPVPALGASVHPRYGVFAPVRGEYVGLVARGLARRGSLAGRSALDVGTGTGVLAFLLARAGARVVATDVEPGAVRSAREDAARLGLSERVEVVLADLFPPGDERFDLVLANPPWMPGEPHGPLDRAVYDPGGEVLARLVAGIPARVAPGGAAWLVLSDLAERLGLRDHGELARRLGAAGLRVTATLETRPSHPRAREGDGPLAAARAAEVTRLYELAPA
ncbi:MAG TPA: methyltransferase [Anaeromyxobacteraceae bacterium]|nr:methyltransferase [Anaeromyxobacteraceae bacterium]